MNMVYFICYIQLTVIHMRILVFSRDFSDFCQMFNLSSAQLLTQENLVLSEAMTYIFKKEIDKKETKVSLFYLMFRGNSRCISQP